MESHRVIAETAAYVCVIVLLYSGAHHVLGHSELRRSLTLQKIWPQALVPLLAASLTAIELTLPLVVLGSRAGLLSERLFGPALLACAATFSVFVGVLVLLLRTNPEASCACGSQGEAVTRYVLIRAALLAVASAAAGSFTLTPEAIGESALLPALVSLPLAVLVWGFPAAMYSPDEIPAKEGALASWT